MVNQSTRLDIFELKAQGFGRRRIAEILDIREWTVRQVLKEDYKSSEREDKKQDRTKLEVKKSRIIHKHNKESKNTKINIKSKIDPNQDHGSTFTTRKPSLKVANISDVHWPYEDRKSEEIVKEYLRDWKPDVIVFNGDMNDCYSISAYNKSPKKKYNIQDELDYGREKRIEWKKDLPFVETWYETEGNHENRLSRLLMRQAPELSPIRELTIPKLIGHEDLGIEYVRGDQELFIGNLLFTHGHLSRKHGGSSARGHFEQFGCSVAVGHCFDEETEILTRTGWKNYKDLVIGSEVMTYNRDKDKLEYQNCTDRS
jgi:metallophosphoesterase superfamily enzyme